MATTTVVETGKEAHDTKIVLPLRRPSYYDTVLNYRLDITEGGGKRQIPDYALQLLTSAHQTTSSGVELMLSSGASTSRQL